jgi:chromosome segregation ATPase
VRLKSLTLTGFKSFPEPTRLDFGPGVSVVVGPNGSGKSNVTDAVLWAMGEQSPLAVRGQSMQDVIFGGGRGVQARSAAEVEIVLDNEDATVDLPVSEISIVRRLDRTGDGGYRLNGARCRLTDVLEVLSDTGLGKETHSVISQGRVEGIVTSKPRDRRLLIEEAAGLGKHRKRRRRAQLKLKRTQENLDRALDVEREARTRLRPLKRQAEAAALHERLERQTLEARWTLALDVLRDRGAELELAETNVQAARERREQVESRLRAVVERRTAAERALTGRSERHDEIARRAYHARSARDRVSLRGEQVQVSAALLTRRIERLRAQLEEQAATTSSTPQPLSADTTPVDADTGPWELAWKRIRAAISGGVERALAHPPAEDRAKIVGEALAEAERLARLAVEEALDRALRTGEGERERREAERAASELAARARLIEQLRAQLEVDLALAPAAERLHGALEALSQAIAGGVVAGLEGELERDSAAGDEVAGELRECAREEAEIQTALRAASEAVTAAEVAAQRLRDQAQESRTELEGIAARLERPLPGVQSEEEQEAPTPAEPRVSVPAEPPVLAEPLTLEEKQALQARVERLTRRREQLGPVNPLAQEEYAQAIAHVEELESRRHDLETALRELGSVIRDTDRQIGETFEQTFTATARNFEELVADLFPGGSGRLRLVRDEQPLRGVLGGQSVEGEQPPDAVGAVGAPQPIDADVPADEREADAQAEREELEREGEESPMGVEIELTPAGKSMKRLSLLSGGEKSMTALAFLFAVFLARPCPFYILDEVEAALDDLNLDRFLSLLRRYADRAQFIVITHQKRTMEAADWLYGVSMGANGVSKVLSRRLPPSEDADSESHDAGEAGAGEIGGEPVQSGQVADEPVAKVA